MGLRARREVQDPVDSTGSEAHRTGCFRETHSLSVNGKAIGTETLDKGYVRIHRPWKKGDVVELDLPMPVRRVVAHEKVAADRGRVALQRGPVVYCVEAVDHGGRVSNLILPADATLTAEHRDDLLGGVTVIAGKAKARTAGADELQTVDLLAIPYYAWDNRDAGEMAVWLTASAADEGASPIAPKLRDRPTAGDILRRPPRRSAAGHSSVFLWKTESYGVTERL